MAHVILDTTGLLCPLPVIKLQQQIAKLDVGDTVKVLCSDPGALEDIPMWCRMYHHRVVSTQEQDGDITLTIEVDGRVG